jgi:hypothetical protein
MSEREFGDDSDRSAQLLHYRDVWDFVQKSGGLVALFIAVFGGTFGRLLAVIFFVFVITFKLRELIVREKLSISELIREVPYRLRFWFRGSDKKWIFWVFLYVAFIFLARLLHGSYFFDRVNLFVDGSNALVADIVSIAFGNASSEPYLKSIGIAIVILASLLTIQLISQITTLFSERNSKDYIDIFGVYLGESLSKKWPEFLEWIPNQSVFNLYPLSLAYSMTHQPIITQEEMKANEQQREEAYKVRLEPILDVVEDIHFKSFEWNGIKRKVILSVAHVNTFEVLIRNKTLFVDLLDEYIKQEVLGIDIPRISRYVVDSSRVTNVVEDLGVRVIPKKRIA